LQEARRTECWQADRFLHCGDLGTGVEKGKSMNLEDAQRAPPTRTSPSAGTLKNVPWQIWIVVVLLAVEGVLGNLPAIPQNPHAAIWFAAKCLFIVGLLRRWRWVFVLFLIEGALHVLAFSMQAPFVAFLNLVLVLLAGSALRFYFPTANSANTEQPLDSPSAHQPGG
jgi:hypothetical protein